MAIGNDNPRTALLKWRRRVGCTRSAPNRENAPPVKKRNRENALPVKKSKNVLAEREQMEAHLFLSHQHQKKKEILDWGEPKNEAAADKDLSVSAKENWSMSVQYDINGTHFSARGGDFYLPDSPQHDINGTHFSAEGGDSYLPASRLQDNTNEIHFSAEEGDSYLPDSLQYNTSGTQFSAEGGDSYLSDSCSQYNTNVAHFSAEGDDSYLPVSCPQHNTNGTQFSGKGDDSHLPDLCPQYNTAEGSTKNEEVSKAEPIVDKWVCGVCKAATVSVLGFPCCHICPCWDCEFEIDSCPICGVARTNGGEVHLPDLRLQYNTNGNHLSGEGGDSYLPYLPQYNPIGTHFSAEGGYSFLPDSRLQYNTNGTHFSAEGDNSYLPDSTSQYEANVTHLLAEGGDSNIPDSRSQYNNPEGSTKNEEASEAESQVDRWACRVCKAAAVSIVVLPCRHLCLCSDCESETDNCPICGEAKTDWFYIRSA